MVRDFERIIMGLNTLKAEYLSTADRILNGNQIYITDGSMDAEALGLAKKIAANNGDFIFDDVGGYNKEHRAFFLIFMGTLAEEDEIESILQEP